MKMDQNIVMGFYETQERCRGINTKVGHPDLKAASPVQSLPIVQPAGELNLHVA